MKERLNVGIVGTGNRGMNCFGFYFDQRDDVDIVALCDTNMVRMKINAGKLKNDPARYTTVEEMLASETLDAVVITTPDCYHGEVAVKALEAGVDCLIDKPLATTVADARKVVETAERTGKMVLMGFNLRHDPTLKRLKQIVDAGTLGKIFLIENREFYVGGRTYMARWNRLKKFSGGLWIHKGSHDFDVFNWLLGFPKPVRVSAMAGVNVFDEKHLPFEVKAGVPVGPTCHECPYAEACPDVFPYDSPEWTGEAQAFDGYAKDRCMYLTDKDTHDNGLSMVEYDSGARASHLECFVTSESDRLYTVVGELGQAEVSLGERTILIKPRWSKETILHKLPDPGEAGHGGADPVMIRTFIDILKGAIPNTSTSQQGIWSTAIGQAAELSRAEGRMVAVDELFD